MYFQERKFIWLIGGTQESAELARAIAQMQLPCVVSVTTEAARSLYPNAPNLHVWVGRLDAESLTRFLQEHTIFFVLDASHPFAVEISKLAIATATQRQIPYLRYQRPLVEGAGGRGQGAGDEGMGRGRREEGREKGEEGREETPSTIHHSLATNTQHPTPNNPFPLLASFNALLASNYLTSHRVLLTVGYRPLALFQPWQERATLFARILPSAVALEAAIAAGFTPDRLIAIRPPISAELERALWRQWQISMVITKASGVAGGEDVKRAIAAELGVTLVAIARPEIQYPQQTSDLATALEFCRQHFISI